jgi:hypothetical protein
MTAQKVGNATLYSGNGVSAQSQRIGNQTVVAGTNHGVPFSGTAQSFGNQTLFSGTSYPAPPSDRPKTTVYKGVNGGAPYGAPAQSGGNQGFYYGGAPSGYGYANGVQGTIPMVGRQQVIGMGGAPAFSHDFTHLPTIVSPEMIGPRPSTVFP